MSDCAPIYFLLEFPNTLSTFALQYNLQKYPISTDPYDKDDCYEKEYIR